MESHLLGEKNDKLNENLVKEYLDNMEKIRKKQLNFVMIWK